MSAVRIITANKLTAAEETRLKAVFAAKHGGGEVDFSFEIDPRIIGGILVIDGGKYYDATLKSQLVRIRDTLRKT